MKKEQTTQKVVDYTDDYPLFRPEMKKDYTILVPDMLPWHFDLLEIGRAHV